ncbi:hypothetical protein K0M31_010689 [Melipona bicolor]|uniref:Uncharacterized protein n=1 Tax=Melipona bicolor TaxID=60889 RepID=A0AA40FKP1_9HYME|nr:hypothetical protein K0M31_010689 [Melipona bicolor]
MIDKVGESYLGEEGISSAGMSEKEEKKRPGFGMVSVQGRVRKVTALEQRRAGGGGGGTSV